MAEKANITRRAALLGALTSTAALSFPVAHAVAEPSWDEKIAACRPEDRMWYYMRMLGEAMHDQYPGLWIASALRNKASGDRNVVMIHRDMTGRPGNGLFIEYH